MLRFFITSRSRGAVTDAALLVLRLAGGVLMAPHGYSKLTTFAEKHATFMNFLGLGSTVSLALLIFAEFVCALFVAAGLFTRFALVPLMIAMLVAAFKAHHGEIFGDGQESFLYFNIFLVLFLAGAGKYSLDHWLFNRGTDVLGR
jgi:putative oxidoreductase